MTNIAIREARRRSRSTTPTSAPGFCKREVRECFRIMVSRSADAAQAWRNARFKHPETNPADIPRGVPVFWLGGSEGHGHVAIATGQGGMWSTDILRPGWFDRTGLRLVGRKWGLRLVGWSEDLDGVRVWQDGKAVGPAHVDRVFSLAAADVDGTELVHEVDDTEAAFAAAGALDDEWLGMRDAAVDWLESGVSRD